MIAALLLLRTLTLGTPAQDTDGFVTTRDGARLHYTIHGTGPTVIVPAALFLERDFQGLATGRRMIFYDMRSRGRSDHIDDSTRVTIQDDIRDLEDVRAHFGIDRFVALGWSYLGRMVMLYAAEHPERLSGLILIGPLPRVMGSRYPADPAIPQAGGATPPSSGDPARDCENEYLATRARLVVDSTRARLVPDLCGLENEWPVNRDRRQQALFVSMYRTAPPDWSVYASLHVPVLVIHGRFDRNAPYGGGREWAGHLPGARFVSVSNAAHMPWLDDSALVLGSVSAFFDRLPPVEAP